MRNLFSVFNVLAAALLAVALAALAWVNRPPPRPEVPSYVLSERLSVEVPVYYLAKDGQHLMSEPRNVPVVQGDQNVQGVAAAALTVWNQGPAGDSALPVVPAGLPAPSVWVRGDNYIVSLPKEYAELHPSASAEYLMLCSLTRTLLEKQGLDVTFLVAGENKPALGAIDLRQPLTAQDCKDS